MTMNFIIILKFGNLFIQYYAEYKYILVVFFATTLEGR